MHTIDRLGYNSQSVGLSEKLTLQPKKESINLIEHRAKTNENSYMNLNQSNFTIDANQEVQLITNNTQYPNPQPEINQIDSLLVMSPNNFTGGIQSNGDSFEARQPARDVQSSLSTFAKEVAQTLLTKEPTKYKSFMQKKVLSPLNRDKKDASNERSNTNKKNISFEQSNEYRDIDEGGGDGQSIENNSNMIYNVTNGIKEYERSKSPNRDQQLKNINSKIL